MIELSGDGRNNGYRLGHQLLGRTHSWGNQAQSVLQWEAKFSESHAYYVGVETRNGFRYLTYHPMNRDPGINSTGKYVQFGIGSEKSNGE